MWILIIIKKNKLRFRWAACKQCAWDTSLTFLPHHLPVNSVLDLWATCPWRQTDANKRIDALISDPKYLFWWPELEKIAIFLFPLFHAPPPLFLKRDFSLQDAGSQDGIGRMSKVPRTTSPCTQLAFSSNAVGAWFSLSIQAGRRRWAPWGVGLGAFETAAETLVNWANVIQLLGPSTRPHLSKIWDGCLCG